MIARRLRDKQACREPVTIENFVIDMIIIIIVIVIVMKAYSEFLKSASVPSSTCRLYNNYVKDTHGHGYNHVTYITTVYDLQG